MPNNRAADIEALTPEYLYPTNNVCVLSSALVILIQLIVYIMRDDVHGAAC
jgi:hypothetical protein